MHVSLRAPCFGGCPPPPRCAGVFSFLRVSAKWGVFFEGIPHRNGEFLLWMWVVRGVQWGGCSSLLSRSTKESERTELGFIKITVAHHSEVSKHLWTQSFKKSPNELAKITLTCDTDRRTKARTPKCRPAFGCSRRALPGPNKKKSVATKFTIFASPGNRF